MSAMVEAHSVNDRINDSLMAIPHQAFIEEAAYLDLVLYISEIGPSSSSVCRGVLHCCYISIVCLVVYI